MCWLLQVPSGWRSRLHDLRRGESVFGKAVKPLQSPAGCLASWFSNLTNSFTGFSLSVPPKKITDFFSYGFQKRLELFRKKKIIYSSPASVDSVFMVSGNLHFTNPPSCSSNLGFPPHFPICSPSNFFLFLRACQCCLPPSAKRKPFGGQVLRSSYEEEAVWRKLAQSNIGLAVIHCFGWPQQQQEEHIPCGYRGGGGCAGKYVAIPVLEDVDSCREACKDI